MIVTTVVDEKHTLPGVVVTNCVVFTAGQLRVSSGAANCAVTAQTLDLLRDLPKLKHVVQVFAFDQCSTPDGVRVHMTAEAKAAIGAKAGVAAGPAPASDPMDEETLAADPMDEDASPTVEPAMPLDLPGIRKAVKKEIDDEKHPFTHELIDITNAVAASLDVPSGGDRHEATYGVMMALKRSVANTAEMDPNHLAALTEFTDDAHVFEDRADGARHYIAGNTASRDPDESLLYFDRLEFPVRVWRLVLAALGVGRGQFWSGLANRLQEAILGGMSDDDIFSVSHVGAVTGVGKRLAKRAEEKETDNTLHGELARALREGCRLLRLTGRRLFVEVVRCSRKRLGCEGACADNADVPILTAFQAAELVLSMEAFAHIFTGVTTEGAAGAIGSSKGYLTMVAATWSRKVLDHAVTLAVHNRWTPAFFEEHMAIYGLKRNECYLLEMRAFELAVAGRRAEM